MLAYFDAFSGISGDMIIGALVDAGLDFERLKAELGSLPLADYELRVHRVSKQQVAATKFDVVDKGKAVYRHLKDLNAIVEQSQLSQEVQQKAKRIFRRIAEAEAKVHGQPVEKVHFHEIGAVDTIIDVVGALIGLKLLNIDRVICSRLNVGSGFVEFSHGRWPVPAPATAELLEGVPIYATDIEAELVTPTGAAIIGEIAEDFGALPPMRTQSVGYGAGTQDLPQPNVLRVFVGETDGVSEFEQDQVIVLETNIDDMNPQIYDHLLERLFEHDALDVFLTGVMMKKNRPGMQVTVLAKPADEEKLIELLFQETTTLGVRRRRESRRILQREVREVETRFGPVRFKVSCLGEKVLNATPEYDDCKRIAREQNLPLKEVLRELARVSVSGEQ